MEELRGKVAVVTGAASGIGLAVSRKAAAEGMRLVVADIEEGPLKAVADELSGGTEVLAVPTDVSERSSVQALCDATLERFGIVHLLHNNAGVGAGGPLWQVTEEDWRWVLGVNLWGVIHGIGVFVPHMVAQGEGHVVNTASLAGLASPPFMGPYNASKHAVVTISETLAKDLRTMGSPVGVSVLCPGFVRTGIADSARNRPSWAQVPEEEAAAEPLVEVVRGLVAGGIDPAQVAGAVFDAVRTERFYILTHAQEGDGLVRLRTQDILERRAPSDTPLV
jgi:NAD(P)-dependent dehydrogenase (short-subunit alcohol dehydrogenase family)